jgi:hypothetical protein
MAAKRFRVELIDELPAGIDHASARYAVHARGMYAMKMQ